MKHSRRSSRLRRISPRLRFRKRFVISAEGSKTEREYFQRLMSLCDGVQISLVKRSTKSAPQYVLKRMLEFIRKETVDFPSEYWLVIDSDQWSKDQIGQLYRWSISNTRFGLAVSNPNFEYWLLLHFEAGHGVASAHDCLIRLRKQDPRYKKSLGRLKFSRERVQKAIQRAEARDTPPCIDWPRSSIGTTVYRLVKKIMS